MSDNLQRAREELTKQVKVDVNVHPTENEAMVHQVSRSFICKYSADTVTVPTKEMYAYAALSSLGDDVYKEPSTIHLERHIAQLFGKEAALFVSSGSMSNQIALRTHLKQPPHSVLCDIRSHIHNYEAGGAAYHSQATVTPVIPSNGHHLTVSDVRKHLIMGTDVVFAPTQVITLENTLNGSIFPQDEVVRISELAKAKGIRMHLDGARIWHVAAETGTPLSELCAPFDSISCCFSKGLGAPVGSCVIGTAEFIARARWMRKLFGGGMRQTGILAGSAAYALSHHFELLPHVHEMAKKLEQGLRKIGVKITAPAETCMVFYDPSPIGLDYSEIADRAANLPDPIKLGGSRLVVHIQTSLKTIEDLLQLFKDMCDEKKSSTSHENSGCETSSLAYDEGTTDYKDIYVRAKPKV